VSALALAACFATPWWARAQDEEEGADPARDAGASREGEGAAKAPEFKTDAAKAAFDEGKSLFAAGDYKKAAQAFAQARKGAKAKEDRDLVDLWVASTKSAPAVDKLKLLAEHKKLLDAYDQGALLAEKHKGTPAGGVFQAFLAGIEPRVFSLLEGFDIQSSKYSEKYGKIFVDDPAIVLHGRSCLEWKSTEDRDVAQLKVEGVPKSWAPFAALELWINVKAAPPEPKAFIICGDKKEEAADALDLSHDAFSAPIVLAGPPGRWQRVRLPLEKFKKHGNASFASVRDFRLQIPGGREFDIYVDRISLLRGDAAAGEESAGKGKGRGGK
jgi:hypothetical protein